MKTKKISELPDFEGKDYVLEAQRRGVQAAFPHITDPQGLIIIGLAQMVAQLQFEIEVLRLQIEQEQPR